MSEADVQMEKRGEKKKKKNSGENERGKETERNSDEMRIRVASVVALITSSLSMSYTIRNIISYALTNKMSRGNTVGGEIIL